MLFGGGGGLSVAAVELELELFQDGLGLVGAVLAEADHFGLPAAGEACYRFIGSNVLVNQRPNVLDADIVHKRRLESGALARLLAPRQVAYEAEVIVLLNGLHTQLLYVRKGHRQHCGLLLFVQVSKQRVAADVLCGGGVLVP